MGDATTLTDAVSLKLALDPVSILILSCRSFQGDLSRKGRVCVLPWSKIN